LQLAAIHCNDLFRSIIDISRELIHRKSDPECSSFYGSILAIAHAVVQILTVLGKGGRIGGVLRLASSLWLMFDPAV
jgi:hypothetical protein